MQDCPTHIYKYFTPARASVLTDARLRYSPLGAFNDPFEGRPSIKALLTQEKLLKGVQQEIETTWRKQYQNLPITVRESLTPERYYAVLTEFAASKRQEIISAADGWTEPVIKQFHELMDEHLGAACFSEVPDSLLMWAHYASDHTGFVVEFDGHHSHFHEGRSPSDDFRRLRRVSYREARPTGALTELDGTRVFLVKSGHWAYEREWRIFRSLKEADHVNPDEPFGIHLFNFPREAVRSIILGARSSDATADTIVSSVSASTSYQNVAIRKAVPDENHFLLRFIDQAA